MSFTIDDMSARSLGVDANKIDIATQDGAKKATTTIDAAIKKYLHREVNSVLFRIVLSIQ